jgi:hypothetical protein
MFVLCYVFLYSSFILCFCIILCIVSRFVYSRHLFLYKFTDHCHRWKPICSKYHTHIYIYIYMWGKQWQTIPKYLPRMQHTGAIPVAWLSSGLCPDQPKGWIPIIIIIIIYNCSARNSWCVRCTCLRLWNVAGGRIGNSHVTAKSYCSAQMWDLQAIYLCVREVAGIVYTVNYMEAIKVLIFREVTTMYVCN